MKRHGIPTAEFAVATSAQDAEAAAQKIGDALTLDLPHLESMPGKLGIVALGQEEQAAAVISPSRQMNLISAKTL